MDTKPEVKEIAELLEKSEGEIARLLTGRKLKIDAVALELNVSPRSVYGLIERGDLFAFRVGGCLRVPEQSLVNYLSRQILQAVNENAVEI